ncbi:coiled-coil domain-containing protein [Micromonospora sp. LOL_024]|uniref:coiled-coil domain-containing protein n=1 Tax=Micromonospora sp. LOL_024 TaxID=3345412 RepID=UPI003A8939FD
MPAVATARPAALIAAVLALTLGAALAPFAPASAAPQGLRAAAPVDDEGGTPALRDQLEAASKGYLDARTALDNSVKRQKQLAEQLATTESQLAERNTKVAEIAAQAYRSGRLGAASALLSSGSPAGFMDRAAALDAVAANEDRAVRELQDTRDKVSATKQALDIEVQEQRKQVAVMAKRKDQAERALTVSVERDKAAERAEAAERASRTAPRSSGSSPTAKAAPRNSDGSWPSESCSVNDPTPANGCITPRTLHALKQAKAAGYTRYVSCYRPGGSGEHPKGRACDFAAQKGGFGGDATGGDRTYGNNLAAYFVKNADRLAVLYVIWYRQIWLPSSGWKSYSGARGDPSSDHTNHVHLSVY